MRNEQQMFADSILEKYDSMRGVDLANKSVSKESLRASAAATPALGHPKFRDLPFGAFGSCEGVSAFIDLRQFTARSFWDPTHEVVWLNTAVLSALCWAIQRNGGYVLGLRGDGVFAFFGDPGRFNHDRVAALAVGATGWAVAAIEQEVNPRLRQRNIQTVQVRAGMDFGELTFVKIGNDMGCEVNPIGFTANFAAKCEKMALAWEMVCGQGLADLLPRRYLDHRSEPPKRYERNGSVERYQHYWVRWQGFVEHMNDVGQQLDGNSAASVGIG